MAMPSAPIRKPEPQHSAATAIDLRGPLRSTQVPSTAAESPSITIAIEKIHATAVCEESKRSTSEVLNTEKA